MRVGLGYDIHPLGDNRPLIMGGIEIPHNKGLLGHSDADVLTHAVCDAILGALCEGDIGSRYPSSDARYMDIRSLSLLQDVIELMKTKGFRVGNLDAVILAQAPRLGPYVHSMRSRLSEIMQTDPARINLKVKSGEGLDSVGREEAIAAHAICYLVEG